MKRIAANDPVALMRMGFMHFNEGDYDKTFEYDKMAAELGDAVAHYNLSIAYMKGQGVEKDEEKEIYHLEEAAIQGHPDARHNLAICEKSKGEIKRAVKHWIIKTFISGLVDFCSC